MANFKEYSCLDGYNEIKDKLGEGYDTLNEEYRGYLEELRDASEEFIVNKYVMNVDKVSDNTLKVVIGANGCYFIMTTRNYRLDFIWHNREAKTIEFWGPKDCIMGAVKEIEKRVKRHANPNTQTQG